MDEYKQQAISSMVDDMRLTMGDFNHRPDKYRHMISIRCRDKQSLWNVLEVFKSLNIQYRHIIFIPRTYKIYNFDTIDVCDVFSSLKSENANLHSIIIRDSDRMESGDFDISIIREDVETGSNDFVSYQSLSRYCNNLQY